jgi:hypothetical protein
MQNLKIDLINILHNEDEKQEAVWMLNKIGYKTGYKSVDFYRYLYACGSGDKQHSKTIQFGNNAKTFRNSDFKEITIVELRDMVKPMKEYLNTETYEYKQTHTKPDGEWFEIPAGAKALSTDDKGKRLIFWKDGFNFIVGLDDQWAETVTNFKEFLLDSPRCIALWVRPQQPEALPFIDDNPQSLNDQYAEIEQVRQQSIEATLAERQSTYGNFEDVAFVTENIMSVLGSVRVNGLSELPTTHRMALYMIASKMARIVNGDFNFIESWHDISGYAKLVEDLIRENNKTC